MTVRRYFGTDGVRDIANLGNMTPEFAYRLGRAYVLFVLGKGFEKPEIAVGRDTRRSGNMIEDSLCAGMMSAGAGVCRLGVIPTPGVSFVLSHNNFAGGAVISASHNPAEYNGIKFLDENGFKLTDEDETAIEDKLLDRGGHPTGEGVGVSRCGKQYVEEYTEALKKVIGSISDKTLPLTIDAANGAASAFVEPIFKDWRAPVCFGANKPDGLNINSGVGVTHMDYLCAETVKNGSAAGIAYDGDTDRVQLCDSKGRTIDGDIILWVVGRWLHKKGTLGSGVTATVMSNMELEDLLAKEGIKVFRCGVGDRYVLDTMRREGSRLGGEQSGHIIALDYANTGDGLYSGALFLTAVAELGEDISTLCDRFEKYPQILRNVRIKNRGAVMSSPEVEEASAKAKEMLGGKGRMLLRPSGTEPLIRIFVESRDTELMHDVADLLEKAILKSMED